jgi:hypothetical protein
MNEIINIFLLSWFLTTFEPLLYMLNFIDRKIKNTIINTIWTLLIIPFSCQKCMAFWLGLIITGNIYNAIMVSLIAYLYGIIVEKIKWINL